MLGKLSIKSFLCEYMAKLLFVVETFADVSGGALDKVCQGELTCRHRYLSIPLFTIYGHGSAKPIR